MTRCPECPALNNVVSASGPSRCDLVFIGEAPGKDEDKKMQVFIGKTGQELERGYLPICNLRRENIRITNAIKCLPPGIGKLNAQRDKDLSMLQSCAEHHLFPELEHAQPKVIIPMGSFACRALDPTINLELQHGFPLQHDRWGTIFPMYHPAGGIHEPKKMLLIRTDWTRLNKFLKGKLRIPTDEYDGKEHYEHVTSATYLRSILAGCHNWPIACDTESTRAKRPFCLTFSTEPGTGFLITADDEDCLAILQEELDKWRGVILWHNWLYDIDVVRRMGLKFNNKLIRDTMLMAFHLGNIPQGLKALSYRELGMTMLDFDDLVTPHSSQHVLEYYRQCMSEDWGKPEPELVRGPDGKWKQYKAQSFNQKLKRFFTDYTKNPEKDIFDMWTTNWVELQAQVEERMGPWPGKCISHAAEADWPTTLRYASRDADATIRLYPVLKRMIRQVRKRPQEHWFDAA